LELNEYQILARKTRLPTADETYSQLNLAGEVGELLGHIAKARRKESSVDLTTVKKEAGDVLWQLSAVLDDFGITLDDAATGNLDKLNDRAERGVLISSGDNR
jgi:NTP pyrophosphatase (non-canonical NTP hydrolase)